MKAMSERRATAAVAALLLTAGLAACGGDDPTNPNALDPEVVVGTYDPATLTFDVAGQTFGVYDLLVSFEGDAYPPALNISNNGTAQLIFQDPVTNTFTIGNGSYTMLEDGLRVVFDRSSDPLTLLLPQSFDLTYDSATGELSLALEIQAPLARLTTLAPELDGEPLSDPIGGLLTVVFEAR